MTNSKTVQYLRALSKDEWEQFQIYLPSLVQRKYKDFQKLFDYIKPFYPLWDDPKLDKQLCFQSIYPGKTYDDKLIRYQLSYLKECLEQFLVIHSVLSSKVQYRLHLEQQLLQRKLLVNFNIENSKTKADLEQGDLRDADYYYQSYQNELAKLSYHALVSDRTEKSNIEDVLSNLDKFYLAKKMQIASEVVNIKNVLQTDYSTFMLDEILAYLENHIYGDEVIIRVYQLIIKTLTKPENEVFYEDLALTLKTNIKRFTRKELYEIYQYLQNYCIKKINQGDSSYQHKLFENYKTQLVNDIIIYSGEISQWDYKNIVTIALRLQEYSWAEHFILTYQNHLNPEQKENAFAYNYANVLFRKGEYDHSLKMLQKVNMTDVYYKLDARSMLLKTYYELNEFEALLYHAQAFKKFLRRDTIISSYQKEIYTHMITLIIKMQKARGIKLKIRKIKTEVENATNTADLAWLKEAVKKL